MAAFRIALAGKPRHATGTPRSPREGTKQQSGRPPYHAPYGLGGGKPGQLGRTIFKPGTQAEQILHAKGNYDVADGDLISWQTAGAGGVGDPLIRDPQRVLDDVLDGFVTVEGARRDYGVVIDTGSMAVDWAATRALRESLAE